PSLNSGRSRQLTLFVIRANKGRLHARFLAPKVTLTLPAKALANPDARIILVRHRSHATFSCQPGQVRKEATVTGSDVCSESPVSGLFFFPGGRSWSLHL